ncbi:hypothetical protein [Candidatus Mycobacterium methanotrophicum]|uniref:Uncharacterized protein n=1 Tax=Candidatus Mycobacterium methanotrophicum TaxID=2943498 RepID=A0ABY4QHY6_9MYCO|nr:hypothetical protein [Candidatus Mycobacterium methanotrophicum]UQX09325.1 hypothetical protein M5I08_12810 [Candidatus Mycobacterium methanotrophicum]
MGAEDPGGQLACGPPGAAVQVGDGGGGSDGAARATPALAVSADVPTPAATTAAADSRFTPIFRLPDFHPGLPANWAA